jgi:putative transposase
MESKRYPTDLSDEEWELLETYLPASKWRGRPRLHSPREILNAVFYVLKSGCQWRMLPREFPPWKTVFHPFRVWRLDGTWERLNRTMRRLLRAKLGRDPEPSAGVVDAQSAKTTGVGGEQRGFDGGKKVKGRKRHLLVDTEGFVLKAKVHSAKVMDYEGIKALLGRAKGLFPRLSHLWMEGGYNGDWQRLMPPQGFVVLPRRWVVERTFSWIDQNRRMSKDYERLAATSEAFIYVAMTRLMVRRLA